MLETKKKYYFGNAVCEKNLHQGGRNTVFFSQFSGDILFSYLVSFAFFDCFVCLFFD